MSKLNKVVFSLVLCSFLSLGVVGMVQAADNSTLNTVKPPTPGESNWDTPSEIWAQVQKIFSWVYTAIVALIFIYIGIMGVKYVTSAGEEEAMEAKDAISRGLVGLFLVLGVGFLIALIFRTLGFSTSISDVIPFT